MKAHKKPVASSHKFIIQMHSKDISSKSTASCVGCEYPEWKSCLPKYLSKQRRSSQLLPLELVAYGLARPPQQHPSLPIHSQILQALPQSSPKLIPSSIPWEATNGFAPRLTAKPKTHALGSLLPDSNAFLGRAIRINDLVSFTKCITFLTSAALAIHCISFYALWGERILL